MEFVRAVVIFQTLAFGLVVEARTSMRRNPHQSSLKALQVHISPKLEPESAEKFEKDLPWDKRPKADALHFGHPYPVVQDSSDYDRDFVKDENSDDGQWKAQETYDRLRAKLMKEKKDLARALSKKTEEENELKQAMQRHAKEKNDKDDANKKVDWFRSRPDKHGPGRPMMKKEEPVPEDVGASKRTLKEVDVSTKDTEKAMSKLEDCKKQLAEARERLKELMKELEDAKATQKAANKVFDEAMQKDLTEREHHAILKKQVDREYEDYQEAKQAYQDQQKLVDQLETDIKAAEAKVRALRDSADKDGGVYPTPGESKSGAQSGYWLSASTLAVFLYASLA
jgi:DNA repair exonuclease SbcCD ATPase subunit